ncbi:putative DNA methylase essential for RIP [Cercophora samala]|uniref:DNA (cytosine-5-)-methyltransferase n=1 Tax=Cercophora samala TaxID=330535 RepID=A0AA39ZCX4_9PEZI|nr:putative DNA methylase essential for RIP [Cercophora samala]
MCPTDCSALRLHRSLYHSQNSPSTWLHPANHHLRLFHHCSAPSSPKSLAFYKQFPLQPYEYLRGRSSLLNRRHRPLASPKIHLSEFARSISCSQKMAEAYNRGSASQPFYIDEDDGELSIPGIKHELEEGHLLLEPRSDVDDVFEVDEFGNEVNPFEELDQEYRAEGRLEQDLFEVIDLTGDDDNSAFPRSRTGSPSDEEILPHWALDDGLVLVPHMNVELRPSVDQDAIEFLRILSIVKITKADRSFVVLRGWGFRRTRNLRGCLPKKLNEVCLIANIKVSDKRDWKEQALVDVSPNQVLLLRDLRMTNAEFPDFRFDAEDYRQMGKEHIKESGPLVCRWRKEEHHHHTKKPAREFAFVRLGEDEVDDRYRVKDSQMANRWRGGVIPGGSHIPNRDSPGLVFDLEDDGSENSSDLRPGQRYTAADIFAGAGGASRGIERSGCRLLFSLDHWESAANSLRRNFPGTHIYQKDVTDFVTDDLPPEHSYPDILHLSPPCQFWSPAHTVAGKDDEKNIAVLFSCTDLIQKLRPRVFTVEQTFGLIHDRFRLYFHTFLQGFTRHGYSLRYKVLHLNEYGLPQTRRRLVIIGAGPGEKLPPFPPPTHSKTPEADGLKPIVTPYQALLPIKKFKCSLPMHNLATVPRYNPPKPRWDPSKPVNTITCSGGQNYHWNGHRQFTDLEYAVLQGFPRWHSFSESNVKKQIGNAFAPSVVRVLYEHIARFLRKQDGVAGSNSPLSLSSSSSSGDSSPIEIPDSDQERDELQFLGLGGTGTKVQPMKLDEDGVEIVGESVGGWSAGRERRRGAGREVAGFDGGRYEREYSYDEDGWPEYREEDFMELDEAGTMGDPVVIDWGI